ncbi:antiterminator Q family protein [Testudinibacter sp. P80/BLE/0925]
MMYESKLNKEQQEWIQTQLCSFGAWVRSGRLDKRQFNMIARFMESVAPSSFGEACSITDDQALLLCKVIDQYLARIDDQAQKIIHMKYIHRMTDNKIKNMLFDTAKPRIMQNHRGMSSYRIPSKSYFQREIKSVISRAEEYIYDMLLKEMIRLNMGWNSLKNIKLCY